ncbi:MAG: response regulator transcription factor [Nitrosomonadales bacterium]|nr:response regulator transcription factor [Nitrosomonadales bacterium]
MRILIIEDDTDIAANLYDYFAARGHDVDRARDGVTGLHFAVSHDYDAILLDLALPGMDGFEVCRRLREQARRDTPVLMLTARDTLEDKLSGFEHGADDYLVKPFALREVEARLLALTKRHKGRVTDRVLQVGDLMFDPETLAVTRAGEPIKLPPKCIRLLELMMQRPTHVYSRAELEQAVWGESLETSDTLRSHMHLLRRALAQLDRPDVIETVHGLGYRLVAR